jgi:transposase-like protein
MGGKQLGFSDYELTTAKKLTKREKFLSEMEAVVPWQALIDLIPPSARKDDASPSRPLFNQGALWSDSMRRYSEAVKVDVRRRMSPPQRQSVAQIPTELGINVVILYSWWKAWGLQGHVVPASQKYPEGWGPADKFTVVLETAGQNETEMGGYCRERGLYPEQVDR